MMSVVTSENELRISWTDEPRWKHDDYCAALRGIPGVVYDSKLRLWRCPLRQADRIFEAFPQASYDYDAICAAVDARRRHIHIFAESMIAFGVQLKEKDGGVIALGENASPLVQQLVNERAAELVEWLAEQQSVAAQPEQPRPQPAANEQRRAAKMTKQNEQ